MGCSCGSLSEGSGGSGSGAGTQYRVTGGATSQNASVASSAGVGVNSTNSTNLSIPPSTTTAGGGSVGGGGGVAPAAGNPVLVSAPRRGGASGQAAGGAGAGASDTVNDFLAERRHVGPGAEQEQGPRFNAYARYLGIDPNGEQDLLWVARCALHAPLPEGWTQHLDQQGRVFFYDSRGGRSSWTHPLEQEHRDVHAHLRRARLSGTNEAVAEEEVGRQLRELEPQAARAAQDWTAHADEGDTAFFYSRSAQRSSWTDPRPAAKHRAVLWRAALDVLEGRVPEETLAALLPGLEVHDQDLPPWLRKSLETGSEGGNRPDSWLSPKLLLAERAVECAVCYEPLYCARPSVLQRTDNGRRLCAHYFCLRCAQRLGGSCPLCRARAPCGCTARALPSVERAPRQWFRVVDNSGNGRLERDEVVHALEAVLPLDAERLRRALGVGDPQTSKPGDPDASGWWRQWQPQSGAAANGDDGISEEDFCAEGGLLQWIVENLRELHRAEEKGRPPELTAESLQPWFEFWASDPAKGLTRSELLRALMRTLGVSGVERQKVREICGTIEHCYHVWSRDGSDCVTREAFVKSPGGLGETLLSALLPCCPEEERPEGLEAPAAPPPAFAATASEEALANGTDREKEGHDDKPAFLKSGSFLDLMQRLSRLRSASEENPGVLSPENEEIDSRRV